MRTVTISAKINSQNIRDKQHWAIRNRERHRWYILLRQRLLPQKPPEHMVSIKITSYRNRTVDFANLVGGAKPIADCLIQLGIIKDDSPKYFLCTYEQFQVPKNEERTEIEI